jgi:hypothetical protein
LNSKESNKRSHAPDSKGSNPSHPIIINRSLIRDSVLADSKKSATNSAKAAPTSTPPKPPVADEFEQKLSPLVNESGAIASLEVVPAFCNLMKAETSAKNQSLLWTVILATRSPQCRRKVGELGGAAVLCDWVQKAKKEPKGVTLLRHALKVLECLPLSIEVLKSSALGKVVKTLKGNPDAEVSQRAERLMTSWMSLVAGADGGSAAPSMTITPLTSDKKRSR